MTGQQLAMSLSLSESILSLGLIACAGFLAQRYGLFGEKGRAIMGEIMIKITFPCLGFHSMVTKVDPALFNQNLRAVGLGALILTAGLLCGYVAVLPTRLEGKGRNTFVHLLSTCNYIFLPLPIIKSLWPEQEGTIFLHSLGCGFAFWIVSIYPLTHGERMVARIKNSLNAPMISMILGLIVALLGGGEALAAERSPEVTPGNLALLVASGVMASMKILGAATVPMALLFVGAALASAESRISKRLMLYYSLWRLLLFPLLFLPVVRLCGLPGEASFVPLLISMMPASNTSTVISHRFGGDADLASAANLWSTPLALLTVPILFPILSSFL
ncbi:MAG: AEC family transporter [Planctomycetota bacterium]|jgi:predicted permease